MAPEPAIPPPEDPPAVPTVRIVDEITKRLEDAGFHVFVGKTVDPAQDELPCVILHGGRDGDRTVQQTPPRRAINLVVEYHCDYPRSEAAPLRQILTASAAIEAALIKRRSFDFPDSLGGVAIDIQHQQTLVHPNSDKTNVWTAQVVIHIVY